MFQGQDVSPTDVMAPEKYEVISVSSNTGVNRAGRNTLMNIQGVVPNVNITILP